MRDAVHYFGAWEAREPTDDAQTGMTGITGTLGIPGHPRNPCFGQRARRPRTSRNARNVPWSPCNPWIGRRLRQAVVFAFARLPFVRDFGLAAKVSGSNSFSPCAFHNSTMPAMASTGPMR